MAEAASGPRAALTGGAGRQPETLLALLDARFYGTRENSQDSSLHKAHSSSSPTGVRYLKRTSKAKSLLARGGRVSVSVSVSVCV